MTTTFNAADFLVERNLREGRGQHTAVIGSSVTWTYEDLSHHVRQVAAGLRDLGVRPGERVLFCMADDCELLTGILAAFYIGAIAVPVSTMLTGPELAKLLVDSRARVLCASVEFALVAQEAARLAPEVTTVVLDGPVEFAAAASVHQWAELTAHEPLATPYATWPDSPALWLYTSGTTGTPKGAMHRHQAIKDVAANYGEEVLGMVPDDRCLSVAKLFFAYGIGNSCFFPLAAGATTVLERARPTPASIAERVRAERPTLFFGVPTFYASLLAGPIPDDTFASVRQGVSAGEALPAALYHRFRDRFGVEILDGIGSTEALHIFVSNRPGQVRPGSSGTPVPGYEVQLRDDDGAVITASGTPGTLFLKGSSVATGYWCRTETSRQVFEGEWLRTGDTYVRDHDGTYACLGRSNDMLKAGGIWVSPAEVEQRLLDHPSVGEAVVVAARDESGLDKPVACVVPAAGHTLDADDLIGWCREGLAAFKRPRAVVAVTELPKTATGKVRRNVLRELVADVLLDARSERHA